MEKKDWQLTLDLLSQRFERASDSHEFWTVVVHTSKKPGSQHVLQGPPKGHWLWQSPFRQQIGKSALVTVDEPHHPRRSIFAGGTQKSFDQFKKLSEQVALAIDHKDLSGTVMDYDDMEVQTAGTGFSGSLAQWILTIHDLGQMQNPYSAFQFERWYWDEDSCQSYDMIKDKPDFFFTASRNTFADSAAAIQMILAAPPKDEWLRVSEAAAAMKRSGGQVTRLVDEQKLFGRGTGVDRRINPRSVIDYLIKLNAADAAGKTTRLDRDEIEERTKKVRTAKKRRKILEEPAHGMDGSADDEDCEFRES